MEQSVLLAAGGRGGHWATGPLGRVTSWCWPLPDQAQSQQRADTSPETTRLSGAVKYQRILCREFFFGNLGCSEIFFLLLKRQTLAFRFRQYYLLSFYKKKLSHLNNVSQIFFSFYVNLTYIFQVARIENKMLNIHKMFNKFTLK